MSQQQAYAQPPAPRPFELDVEKLRDLERHNKLPVFTTFQDHADGDFTVIVAGKGVYLWDAEGNQYLDGCSGIGNVGLGYDQTEIADAVHAQMKTLPFHLGGWNFSTPPSIELAAKLTQHAPDGLNRVIFVSGGSEANETVIKVSRLYFRLRGFEKKTTAIALDRSYHGATYGAASLTGLPHMHEHFEPMLSKVRHIPTPYRYRCEQCGTQPACTLACADMLEKVILEEGPETVAFFIAEPVLGGGGGIPLPPEYFQRIRAICDKYDVLMVSDEVITGFGRTGKMFAIEHAGVTPDMISTAKGINSGYLPLGAVLLHEKIYDTFLQAPEGTDFSHGYTNSGHPVCCAAGLKTLEIMERDQLVDHAARMGALFHEGLAALHSSPIVGDVRGLGLTAGLEFVQNKEMHEPFPPEYNVADYVRRAAMKRGLLVRELGPDIIFMAPPLIITQQEVGLLLQRLKDTLTETEAWLAAKA